MKKIGICGVYGVGPEFSGGQPVKTRMIIDELSVLFGKDQVQIANTHNWKRNPIKLINNCLYIMKNCENIIILPAQNGIRVFVPFFLILNKIYRRKIHYIVIGGWLPDYLKKYKSLKAIAKFKGVYVETNTMKRLLESLSIKNVYIMNNFKKLNNVDVRYLNISYKEPYKLCYFSRIIKGKGVEDAIVSTIEVNETFGREVYKLDLYGYIDESYKNCFEKFINKSPSYIKYYGVVSPDKSVDTMKSYFMHIFPTKYKTEGIPGSIIDSYFAGVPVLASKWNSFNDVIEDGRTGLGFEFSNIDDLKSKLIEVANNPQMIVNMKMNCIEKAKQYSPSYVIKDFVTHL